MTLAKGHLRGIFFLSKTTSLGCTDDHHLGNVTLFLHKISKFIVKNMSKKLSH